MSDSPEKVSESFCDAHRNAVLWSAICLAWVGFSVSPEKIKYLDFLVPSRIPLALLLTWVYLSWRFVAELMGNLAAVRSERWHKCDTVLAPIVGSAGVMLFADLSFRLPETRESGMPFIENSGYSGVMFASVCAAGFLRALRNTRKNKWIRRAIAVLELLTVGYCLLVFFAASIVWVLPPKSRGDVEWTAMIGTFWIVLALGVYWATKPVLQLIGFMVSHPEHGADH